MSWFLVSLCLVTMYREVKHHLLLNFGEVCQYRIFYQRETSMLVCNFVFSHDPRGHTAVLWLHTGSRGSVFEPEVKFAWSCVEIKTLLVHGLLHEGLQCQTCLTDLMRVKIKRLCWYPTLEQPQRGRGNEGCNENMLWPLFRTVLVRQF